MSEVLYRTETWDGAADLASIDGRTFSDGEGQWSVTRGAIVTEGEKARISAVFDDVSVAIDSTFEDRDFMRIEVAAFGDQIGLIGRVDSAENYYFAYRSGANVHLYRVVANVPTLLDSGTIPGGGIDGDEFALECSGSTLKVLWEGSTRITYVDAGPTYPTGGWGIRLLGPGQYVGTIHVYVDSSTLPTTPAPTSAVPTSNPGTAAPTTPAPTTATTKVVHEEARVIMAKPVLDYMAGVFRRETVGLSEVITIAGYYGDTATDVLTGACWDTSGYCYYAYKQGANIRIVKIHNEETLEADEWDVALTTMDSASGRACPVWEDGVLYVWVHNDTAAANAPTIYRLNPATGAIVAEDAGSYWTTTTRSPSASVEGANPGGANNGHWPSLKSTSTRLFLLGMEDDKSGVYLEIRNRQTGAQVADVTLEVTGPPNDEVYPRGMAVDPINEYVFVTWADYRDSLSRDEPNRASYDRNGTERWTVSTFASGHEFQGGIFYDIENDRLLMAGGIDAFGQTNESVSELNPATGARTDGGTLPGSSTVALGVMYLPTFNEIMVINNGVTTGIFAGDATDLSTQTASNAANGRDRIFEPFYLYADPLPTTVVPTTPAPLTAGPSTAAPTTLPEPTFPPEPTTEAPLTDVPTTAGPTGAPTTAATTIVITTVPYLLGDLIGCAVTYESSMDRLDVLAWLQDEFLELRDERLDLSLCVMRLIDEDGVDVRLTAVVAPEGGQFARFVLPQARLYSDHVYLLELTLQVDGGDTVGPVLKGLPVA